MHVAELHDPTRVTLLGRNASADKDMAFQDSDCLDFPNSLGAVGGSEQPALSLFCSFRSCERNVTSFRECPAASCIYCRYRREFEKSLPDIFEQFEIGRT